MLSPPDTTSEMEAIRKAQRALAVDFKAPPQNQDASLEGKTLLVTGGASGFGEAIVTAFAKSPDTAAIIADNNSERGEELERSLREAGRNVKFVQVDVTNWESVTSLFRTALIWLRGSYGHIRTIDHIVTCAGVISENLDLTPADPEDFIAGKTETKAPASRSINISIIGTLYTVTAAMRYGMGIHQQESVAERSDKSVTMLGSMAGYSGTPLQADYNASKYGIRGIFRSLLDDSKASSCPVRVNVIAPYFVRTPLTEAFVPYMQELGIKLGDIGDVEAAAMRFMCDKSVHGRAAGVWQGGAFDLGDDYGGAHGSAAMLEGVESGALRRSGVYLTKGREVS